MTKFLKLVAISACALVALAVGVSSATAGAPTKATKDSLRYDRVVGSCDNTTPGAIDIAGGVAKLSVPEQMSWAQIRSYPQNLKLNELKTLKFDSNAHGTPGVVYMKITTAGQGSVLFSPNTQPGGVERGLNSSETHNVLTSTVRYQDDAGNYSDISWAALLNLAGDAQVQDVRMTAGCANPVPAGGAQVDVDNLTINNKAIGF